MPKGLLVDDGVVSGLWWVFLSTLEEGDIVLGDGVFRKIGQTIQIVEKMWDKERLFSVVNIDIPEEEVYKRLTSRIVCKSCSKTFSILQEGDISECPACKGELVRRNDDEDKKAIATRIEAFHRDTVPCLEWLEKQGVLVRLDGMKPSQELFQDILAVMSGK